MLIKSADDKGPQLEALAALLARSDLEAETRRRIDQEVRSVRAGIAGERDAARQAPPWVGAETTAQLVWILARVCPNLRGWGNRMTPSM